MRICEDLDAALDFRSLYFAYVRSHLEYAAVVWNPSYDVHINKIEYMQKTFFSVLFMKFGYYSLIQFAPYTFKCSILNIEPLSISRKCNSALFAFDTLTGRVDSCLVYVYVYY